MNFTSKTDDVSTAAREIDLALRFTETYQSFADVHPAEREAACLAVQYPALMPDIQPQDLLAGRIRDDLSYIVMFSPQTWNEKTEQAAYAFSADCL